MFVIIGISKVPGDSRIMKTTGSGRIQELERRDDQRGLIPIRGKAPMNHIHKSTFDHPI